MGREVDAGGQWLRTLGLQSTRLPEGRGGCVLWGGAVDTLRFGAEWSITFHTLHGFLKEKVGITVYKVSTIKNTLMAIHKLVKTYFSAQDKDEPQQVLLLSV